MKNEPLLDRGCFVCAWAFLCLLQDLQGLYIEDLQEIVLAVGKGPQEFASLGPPVFSQGPCKQTTLGIHLPPLGFSRFGFFWGTLVL